jgi:uncharacterized membrane protein
MAFLLILIIMDAALLEVLGILMRWVHIACMALVVGGIAYARLIVWPSMSGLQPAERTDFIGDMAARYRPVVFAAAAGLIVSGLYNFLTRRGHTSYYHMWFGIKMLLVAHVLAVAFLLVKPPHGQPEEEDRRGRQMIGVVISGFAVLLISAYLRRIF